MIVKFYGTRGSVPVCDANFQKFGGNTTCISIYIKETDNIFIIVNGSVAFMYFVTIWNMAVIVHYCSFSLTYYPG